MSVLPERLHNKRVGLALSGGAVRGLAHIGVIKALHEAGIRPSVITGTSVGSIIGSALAAGMEWREIAGMARSVFWPRLLHGKSLETFAANYLPPTLENLKVPFAAVATIVPSNQALTITSGCLASALSASCAVRLFRRSVSREGLQLKDGGFSCVLPAQACRELGADFVISSDVWELSSVMRSLGYSPLDQQRNRIYPRHYLAALANTDIHIHPQIPLSGYIPGSSAVNKMIAVGEHATYRALESLSNRRSLNKTNARVFEQHPST
jgi:predicted acylesterase/phospholipase RssA